MTNLFPTQFSDLETTGRPWALASYNYRYAKRLNSSMDDMQKFYDLVFPRGEQILDYCDQFDINDPPDDVRALMNMMYSLVTVSFAVEVWKQPRVPDSGACSFEAFDEPAV